MSALRKKEEVQKMKKLMMMAAATAVSGMALADVSVDNIVCTQRYPWNGLVDIDYTVACDDPNAEIYVNPVGFNGDTGLTVFPTHFTGDGATNTVKVGRHRMVWDAKADMGAFSSSNFQIKMYAGKELSRYIVIDISGGTNATNFAIRRSIEGPNLTDDTCRTSEIWMRLIPPGTFMMGSPSNELGRADNEDLHKVTITKPFYIGVFEVTQKQWELVKGDRPSYYTNDNTYATMPVERLKSSDLKNISSFSSSTCGASSFLGLIRSKTAKQGFDLPTEAQWEYACRAGTLTALNSGENLMGSTGCSNLGKLGRYSQNGSTPAKVGSYLPNRIGLYDMLGNVREYTSDGYVEHLGILERSDPHHETKYVSGNWASSYRQVVKGGDWNDNASTCRAGWRCETEFYRSQSGDNFFRFNDVGFRLCCTGNLQQ